MGVSKRGHEAGGHPVVSREEWLAARIELLAREKELTRARDELSRQRRGLPWVRVGQEYAFDTERGRRTLADLFGGRRQLIVYHTYSCYSRGWTCSTGPTI